MPFNLIDEERLLQQNLDFSNTKFRNFINLAIFLLLKGSIPASFF
jgi:hypothetical protein